jgi:hypothetical protein
VSDLIAFLRARLDEDEAAARVAHLARRPLGSGPRAGRGDGQAGDPGRVGGQPRPLGRPPGMGRRRVLALAQVYAAHPDFDPAWRIS